MNVFKTFVASAAIASLASTSFAGGLANEIMEAPIAVEEEMMAPAGSSLDPSLIVLGILGLLLIGASIGEDDTPDRCQQQVCVQQQITTD